MKQKIEKRKDEHGKDVDVHVLTPPLAPQQMNDAIAEIQAALDRHFPNWRKGN